MGVLLFGPEEKVAIADALTKARQNAIPWEVLEPIADGSAIDSLDLDEREGDVESVRRKYPAQHVVLGTYRIAISFEYQPVGLFRHLSISSAVKGKVPGLEVLAAVLVEFGFSGCPLQRPGRIWIEEFQPGWRAVNVIELDPPLS